MLSSVRSANVSINGRYLINDPGEASTGFAKNADVSFEVFPAKDGAARGRLVSELGGLQGYEPEYVSVTYGAGGGDQNRDATLRTALAIRDGVGANIMAHLSLGGQSRKDVLSSADAFAEAGIKQILALRGDGFNAKEHEDPDRFASSVELIDSLSKRGWEKIRTTAYPDPHPDSRGGEADLDFLLAKFDAGASEAITQFFFDADSFLRLRDRLDKHGLGGKLVPGLLAFSDAGKMAGFAEKCGVRIPEGLMHELSANNGMEASQAHCVSIMLDLWLRLGAEGISRYHMYTLNKAEPTLSLLKLLEMPVDSDA